MRLDDLTNWTSLYFYIVPESVVFPASVARVSFVSMDRGASVVSTLVTITARIK